METKELTQKQKAEAFDLIASGVARGMVKFWEHYDELRGKADTSTLERMASFATQEAAEMVLKLEL